MKRILLPVTVLAFAVVLGAHPAAAATAHFQGDSLAFSHTVDFDSTRPIGGGSTCNSGTPTFAWNFGDGSTTTGDPVSHVFSTSSGAYTVTLTVTCPEGTATVSRGVCFAFGFPGCIGYGVGWN